MQRLIKRFIAKLRWEKKRLQAVILIQRAERKHIFWSRFVLQRRHQAASVIGKAMEGRLAVRRAKEERKRLQDDKSVAVRVAELIERYRLMAAIFTETLPVRDTPLYPLYTLSYTTPSHIPYCTPSHTLYCTPYCTPSKHPIMHPIVHPLTHLINPLLSRCRYVDPW